MSKNLLVLSPLRETLIESLPNIMATGGESAGIEVTIYGGSYAEELLEAVKGADVILGDYTFTNEIDAGIIEAASGCKLMQQPSTGYQHIDVNAARRLGIPVANVAGANAISVAEHAIMLFLACLEKLLVAHEKTMRAECGPRMRWPNTVCSSCSARTLASWAQGVSAWMWQGGPDLLAAIPSPSNTWYLPEGYTAQGFDTCILMQNPYDTGANVAYTCITERGTVIPKSETIGPNSRYTVKVDDIHELSSATFSTHSLQIST